MRFLEIHRTKRISQFPAQPFDIHGFSQGRHLHREGIGLIRGGIQEGRAAIGLHQTQFDPRSALAKEPKGFGALAGSIQDAPPGEGASVIDPKHHPFPVFKVFHFHKTTQGQGSMGTGQLGRIEQLTIGGGLALEAILVATVPTGFTQLVVTGRGKGGRRQCH